MKWWVLLMEGPRARGRRCSWTGRATTRDCTRGSCSFALYSKRLARLSFDSVATAHEKFCVISVVEKAWMKLWTRILGVVCRVMGTPTSTRHRPREGHLRSLTPLPSWTSP